MFLAAPRRSALGKMRNRFLARNAARWNGLPTKVLEGMQRLGIYLLVTLTAALKSTDSGSSLLNHRWAKKLGNPKLVAEVGRDRYHRDLRLRFGPRTAPRRSHMNSRLSCDHLVVTLEHSSTAGEAESLGSLSRRPRA